MTEQKRSPLNSPSSVVAAIGSVASVTGLIITLASWLGFSTDLILSLSSVFFALVAGILSKSAAKWAGESFYNHIFISHAGSNADLAGEIADRLKQKGARVWLSGTNLKPGDNVVAVVSNALKNTDKVIFIVSTDQDPHLNLEIEQAVKLNRRIIPVIVGNATVPDRLKNIQAIKIGEDRQQEIDKLVENAANN